MKELISVVNKLQDVFNQINVANTFELPQIVAIGSQSSGKSSVIESIVRRSFLPRGTGIVTRRPLVLQLVKTSPNSEQSEEWGEFSHNEEKFTDFDEICKEIEQETDFEAGENKGISDKPINLKIFSPHVVDLTLVDLPGFTKVPVGDQPGNIERQIKKLVFHYISNPNSIILAVSSANANIATSEAIKFAKVVDPEGKRTLGVLTKLDLMDKGTDATAMLKGDIISMNLGIVGVVNRSQQDIIDKKGITEQLRDEEEFFEKFYPKLAKQNGTPYLERSLSERLINHIKECLPELKKRIKDKLSHYDQVKQSYGEMIKDGDDSMLLKIINIFVYHYRKAIEGSIEYDTRIYKILHEKFENSLKLIKPEVEFIEKIDIESLYSSSLRPTLYDDPSFDALFQKNVKKFIKELRNPSLHCIEMILMEMNRIIEHCGKVMEAHFTRFPYLQKAIVDEMSELIESFRQNTKKMTENLIHVEVAYINKIHPDFDKSPVNHSNVIKDWKDINRVLKNGDKNNEIRKKSSLILENLVTSYCNIVQKDIQDFVPKTIMCFLINNVIEEVGSHLITNVYKARNSSNLLTEAKHIELKRKEVNEMLQALQEANKVIDSIDINLGSTNAKHLENGDI
ncbi:CLUMA_CG000851, isoform A [Clunio marinus]|uniref:CLUMA_CG000851, isoform A n=1 Tax=Clunio marinus TaxID=568069 RepID=A0A1J1HGC3_9DIPT|nr:CLUMA_CG000851, isoform A [Clunio marinus]